MDGDKEYGDVFISIENLKEATEKIKSEAGQIVAEQTMGDSTSVLAYDSQGAAFFLLGENSKLKKQEQQHAINHEMVSDVWALHRIPGSNL